MSSHSADFTAGLGPLKGAGDAARPIGLAALPGGALGPLEAAGTPSGAPVCCSCQARLTLCTSSLTSATSAACMRSMQATWDGAGPRHAHTRGGQLREHEIQASCSIKSAIQQSQL
jgi:hypothetical protein